MMNPDFLEQKISYTRGRIEYVLREYNACLELDLASLSSFYRDWLIELLNCQGTLIASLGLEHLRRSSRLCLYSGWQARAPLPGIFAAVLYSRN